MVKDQDIVDEALSKVLPKYEKSWYRVPNLRNLDLILIVPLLSSAVAGHDGSMMNGLQSTTSWKNYFNHPAGTKPGVVNAAQSIGSVAILPIVSTLSDKLGRRWTLLSGILTIIATSIIQAVSVNYGMFVASRIIVGCRGHSLEEIAEIFDGSRARPRTDSIISNANVETDDKEHASEIVEDVKRV